MAPSAVILGTVIHGTYRDCDLIPAFMGVLREHDQESADRLADKYGVDFMACCSTPEGMEYPTIEEQDLIEGLMEDLYYAFGAIAPDGYYFGANEGDGSDFGFWYEDDDPIDDPWSGWSP